MHGEPDCAAFLAASVLAAYRMQADDEAAAHAYYVRLAELLRCDMSAAHPTGFHPAAFESLWVFLQNWLREEHDLRLARPTADVGLRRFVALPLAHVPLRCLDIEKLPTFFYWAGYEPGGRVPRDRLYADLCMWQQARSSLTQPGIGFLRRSWRHEPGGLTAAQALVAFRLHRVRDEIAPAVDNLAEVAARASFRERPLAVAWAALATAPDRLLEPLRPSS